ncbi:MAG TPA: hypothetical protein VHP33_17030 [Polyangiaceae bacterium]|nr:hypothetical protein [Polyangiaceae bacterium]
MKTAGAPTGSSKVVWLIVAAVLAPIVMLLCVCIFGIVVGFFWG